MMTTKNVFLGSSTVEYLEPTEGTDNHRSWISPFAVPRSAEVDTSGPGRVRSIRFHYLEGEPADGKGGVAEKLDPRTDPEVDLLSDQGGKVLAIQCKAPADDAALGRIADRLTARSQEETAIARRFSLLMTARVLKVWAEHFAGTEGSGRPPACPAPGDTKMVITKMFDQGELLIELVQPYLPDPKTGDLTESGRWMALIHKGAVSWFSGGPLMDPATRRTALFDTKEAAFKAAIDFAKSCGLREL